MNKAMTMVFFKITNKANLERHSMDFTYDKEEEVVKALKGMRKSEYTLVDWSDRRDLAYEDEDNFNDWDDYVLEDWAMDAEGLSEYKKLGREKTKVKNFDRWIRARFCFATPIPMERLIEKIS